MNKRATSLECSLSCPWTDSGQCLRILVKESIVLSGHLGGGQLSGLRSMYHPHDLPPCVKPNGCLHWDNGEDHLEPTLPYWADDGPAL